MPPAAIPPPDRAPARRDSPAPSSQRFFLPREGEEQEGPRSDPAWSYPSGGFAAAPTGGHRGGVPTPPRSGSTGGIGGVFRHPPKSLDAHGAEPRDPLLDRGVRGEELGDAGA